MPTLSDLIAETRTHLYANQSPEGNRLANPMGAGDTSMALTYEPGSLIQRGSVCCVDLEHIRCWNAQNNTITVERGVDGTTAASHSLNAFVEPMPKFSAFMIQRAINEDLDDLASPWNGLFSMVDLELTYNAAVSGYDMTGVTQSQVLSIQELRYKIPGPSKHLPAIRRFKVARNVPTSDYPSGMALLLEQGAFPGLPIHVRYRSRFSHLVNLTDDVQSVAKLPPEANGLPAVGAACSLMAGREVKRNFTESTSDPLQLELVTGGQVLNSYKGLLMLRQQRIQAVAAGLLKQYGSPLRVI
jgi:hypothetical protein